MTSQKLFACHSLLVTRHCSIRNPPQLDPFFIKAFERRFNRLKTQAVLRRFNHSSDFWIVAEGGRVADLAIEARRAAQVCEDDREAADRNLLMWAERLGGEQIAEDLQRRHFSS